ncbi:MAG TPA: response regulator [Chloroflexota bacterium]|nr:response regulator [Chloroflexota bacterium]
MVDRFVFEQHVQEALDHLYDPAYLLVHPLTTLVVPRGVVDPPGQALHRILRDAIGQLKPPADAPSHSPSWRSYRYLSLRYVEMLTIGQVAAELGVSPRQCRRDHHEALHSVVSILWDRYRHATPGSEESEAAWGNSEASPRDRGQGTLAVEVGKLGLSSPASVADVERIVESVVATLSALAFGKNVRLCVEVPVALPTVLVDRTALRQMLLELLLDALDRGEGGEVVLGAASSAEHVVLTVVVTAATGSNDRSLRDHNDDNRLEVCRKLADLQGVTMQVQPRANRFTASLVLPSGQASLVLVVDDNADVVHLYRRYLEGIYEVVEAANGEQAIQLARETHPRIITLDVMMPSQDGWEVLQTLKHDPATADVPIIVCSVLRERELALSLGAADFLAKPITGRQLVSALHRCRLAS